jgi:hypothetical protein
MGGGDMTVRATVLTGGHPFEAEPFSELLGALHGVRCTHVAWPDAQAVFEPGGLDATDVLVLYDMQGVGFNRTATPDLIEPPDAVVTGWHRLLSAGVPVVAWHHALAAWPAWPEYAEIVGGRYHYRSAPLRGVEWPDSGYRHNVHQTLSVVAPQHPVCAGLPPSFELVDEPYLCPVFEEQLTPLLVSDAPKTDDQFFCTRLALSGQPNERGDWTHPPGSPLAAWTHTVDRSTVVYIQPGDARGAYENPNIRRLLSNAITWAATTRPSNETREV